MAHNPRSVAPQRIVAETFLASLAAHEVDYLFVNPGTDSPPLVEAYARAALRREKVPEAILAPHENLAVGMAHGAYLMTGRTQAVMLHVNVGTANAVNMLANLARDNVPLLLCAGRTPITESGQIGSRNRQIHWAQEMFDQAGMVRELAKWDYEFRLPGRIDAVTARALEIASTSPKGPVYLQLPREPLASAAPSEPLIAPRTPPRPPHPDPGAITEIATWLAAAHHPVIITSASGADVAGFDALATLAEAWAIPVVPHNPRTLCLATDHPMHAGYDPAPLLRDADLVLIVACDAPWLTAKDAPPVGARIVEIGEDPTYQRYPMRSFPADIRLTATAATALNALSNAAEPARAGAARLIRDRRAARVVVQSERLARLTAASRPAADRITPAHLSHAIGAMLRPDDIVFNEYPLLLDHVPRTRPGTLYGLSPAGGLGWGLPAALGAKLAAPNRCVVATLGDGAYLFANPTACHWIADRYKLPVLTIIFNNGAYGAVKRATMSMYADAAAGSEGGMRLADLSPSPPFHDFVTAQGGHGERVERPQDLLAALARARTAVVEKKQQALLNVICPY